MTHQTLGLTTWAAALLGAAPALAGSPFDLRGKWQLFVDDHVISSRSGATRVWHGFEKYAGNPILKVDRPWERDVVNCTTVLPTEDGSGYRMWYYCWGHKEIDPGGHSLYATSSDGITWEKPKLGIHKWKGDGTTDNNIIYGGASVMYTPDDPDPARRYKAVAPGEFKFKASPDGINWEPLSKEQLFSAGDTGHVMWDPFTNKYRGYAKVGAVVSGMRRRAVGYSEGTGFGPWPAMRLIMAPDDFDNRWAEPGSIHRAHFYNCPVMVYQDMYIGLMMVYRGDDDEGYFHGPIHVELMTSRDGLHWNRQDGERTPMLTGGASRTFDHGMVTAASILLVGDQLRLYYSGYNGSHDHLPFFSAVGIAHMRRDGFASMEAEDTPGTVTTKRLQGAEGALRVNCQSKDGLIQVEVLDTDWRVIPGYSKNDCISVRADSVDQPVAWKKHKELPAGKDLVLRFFIRNAALYSFHAGDGLKVLDDPPGRPLAALYTFEGDGGKRARDRLTGDGEQELRVLGTSRIEGDAKNAAFGNQSVQVSSPWRPLNTLQIAGSSKLGKQFTLAVMARSADNKPARLFSSYNGNKPVNTSELVFDCDPRGKALPGLRLICKGIPVTSKQLEFADGKFHHLAVTYDDGAVRFYLDGEDAGEAWLPNGAPVTMARDLLVGEDAEMGSDEQFMGYMDDILVLGRTLTQEEIRALATNGAEASKSMLHPK